MACRKMNEYVAYARNTESGCKVNSKLNQQPVQIIQQRSYMAEFGFLKKQPSGSILDPLQLIKLVGWQAIETAVAVIDAA